MILFYSCLGLLLLVYLLPFLMKPVLDTLLWYYERKLDIAKRKNTELDKTIALLKEYQVELGKWQASQR